MVLNEEDPFMRKSNLVRSPQRIQSQNQTTPTNVISNIDKNVFKRGLQETTLDDLFNLIHENGKKQIDKLDEVKTSIKYDMASMKEELNANIDKCQQNIDKKIDLVEKKADQGLRIALESRKMCINMLKQARLDCCMDISGLKFADDNNDSKKLALNTIRSFNIRIEEADIKKVTSFVIKKPNSSTNKILTVTFDDIETKLRVMREKSKIKDSKGVFFNITLTPENGYYLRKAKYITKGTTLKPKFFDGGVHVQTANGTDLIVQSEENLTELANMVEELSRDAAQNIPQSSGSSNASTQ